MLYTACSALRPIVSSSNGAAVWRHYRVYVCCQDIIIITPYTEVHIRLHTSQLKIHLDLLSKTSKGGPLSTNDLSDPNDPSSPTVLESLRKKHPPRQPLHPPRLVSSGDPPSVHPVFFDRINTDLIKSVTLDTRSSAGPSGLGGVYTTTFSCKNKDILYPFWPPFYTKTMKTHSENGDF